MSRSIGDVGSKSWPENVRRKELNEQLGADFYVLTDWKGFDDPQHIGYAVAHRIKRRDDPFVKFNPNVSAQEILAHFVDNEAQ